MKNVELNCEMGIIYCKNTFFELELLKDFVGILNFELRMACKKTAYYYRLLIKPQPLQ